MDANAVRSMLSSGGLSLRGDAMRLLLDQLGSVSADEAEPLLQLLVDELQSRNLASSMLSAADVSGALAQLSARASAGAEAMGGVAAPADAFVFVDVQRLPQVSYDAVRKSFHHRQPGAGVLGAAESKVALYRERFHLLAQRLSRNKHFTRPALRASADVAGGTGLCELTPLQGLLGSAGQTRFVLGCLSQLDDGRYSLEDATGACAVDLSAAATSDGLFAENCVVVAEGTLRRDGVFEAHALGFPPVEPRAESRDALGAFDIFGAGVLRTEEAARLEAAGRGALSEHWLLLSDLFLDRPPVLAALRMVLDHFEAAAEPPALILMMGDFCSSPSGASLAEHAAGMARLAELLQPYTQLRQRSRFAFMPGPGDPGPAACMPRPPLPISLTRTLRSLLPHAHFLSCPARLRWNADSVVFSRDDVAGKLRRACVRPPADAAMEGEAGEQAAADRLFGHTCATLLQQSHLSPLPLQHAPVFWEHDAALWLFPTPHALLLADRSAHQAQIVFEDCACLNTGSFGTDGSFAIYRPATRESELSKVELAAS